MKQGARRGSWTLIELVVAMVILVALAAWLVPRYLGTGKNTLGKNTIQAPIQRAEGTECQSNLQQLRSAITMSEQSNEHFPASLNELTGMPRQMFICPVSNQPYLYDPRTGKVGCPYPPHRGY